MTGAAGDRFRARIRAFARPALGCCALVMVAGCAATPPIGDVSDADGLSAERRLIEREARLRALTDYRVGGGFGYWDDSQNLTADIDWTRSPERLDILLVAPLGLGRLAIEQDAGGARILRSGRPAVAGREAGTLLQRALGLAVPVPIDRLGDWIRGLPGPDAERIERDAQGRLATLAWRDGEGNLWRANVRRYRQVDGLDLPALLTARNGERHLRLALSDWAWTSASEPGEPSDRPAVEPPTPAAPIPTPSRRLRLPGAAAGG